MHPMPRRCAAGADTAHYGRDRTKCDHRNRRFFAASTWLAAKNNDLTDCLKKLELVDEAYRKLLTDEARELLNSAGCEDVEITWGRDPREPLKT